MQSHTPLSSNPLATFTPAPLKASTLSYEDRAKQSNNPLSKRIFEVMAAKQTNLCVAADVKTVKGLLELADNVGPHICVLKTHYDIVKGFNEETIKQLVAIAAKHNFILFEDRKFADIGSTAADQYAEGIFDTSIAEWSPLSNAHSVPGEDMVLELQKAAIKKGKSENGVLLIAEMSSKGNLAVGDYTKETIKMAERHADFVVGFITQRVLSPLASFINFTPGINCDVVADGRGQQYNTPEIAFEKGTDIMIVGRGVFAQPTPAKQIEEAKRYQIIGWNAYQNRVKPAMIVENTITNSM
jgi:orotidine 5'-phosphate decarboxylase subfamily 1